MAAAAPAGDAAAAAARLAAAADRRRAAEARLAAAELKLYHLETLYLEECAGAQVARGWSTFSRAAYQNRGSVKATDADRVFTLSSVTAPTGPLAFPFARAVPAPGAAAGGGVGSK